MSTRLVFFLRFICRTSFGDLQPLRTLCAELYDTQHRLMKDPPTTSEGIRYWNRMLMKMHVGSCVRWLPFLREECQVILRIFLLLCLPTSQQYEVSSKRTFIFVMKKSGEEKIAQKKKLRIERRKAQESLYEILVRPKGFDLFVCYLLNTRINNDQHSVHCYQGYRDRGEAHKC